MNALLGELKSRSWDDPLMQMRSWFAEREQGWIRQVISDRYKGIISPQVYWATGTDKEKEGLSGDPVEQLVQRLSLSQIGVYFAHRIWARRNFVITPVIFLIAIFLSHMLVDKADQFNTDSPYIVPLFMVALYWMAILLFLASILFGPVLIQLFMPRIPVRQDEIDSVKGIISRCVVRDLPEGTPPDLQDRMRLMGVDAHGRSVAGQVLATDLAYSAVSAEWANTKAVLFWLGLFMISPVAAMHSPAFSVLIYLLLVLPPELRRVNNMDQNWGKSSKLWLIIKFLCVPLLLWGIITGQPLVISGFPLIITATPPIHSSWFFILFVGGLVLYKIWMIPSPLGARAIMLNQAVCGAGTEPLIDKAGRTHFVMLENARNTQIKVSMEDPSPFIPLGVSTGLLAQRRDPLAPTEAGLPVGLSVHDLSDHLGVLGASETGKTFGIIRPLAKTWLHNNLGGLLVLDGKGTLPQNIEDLDANYQLISPERGKFNPIQHMSPDAVADVLAAVFSENEQDNAIWGTNSAKQMLHMAAIIVKAHPDIPYTLPAIQEFCTIRHNQRMDLFSTIKEQIEMDAQIKTAARYWINEVASISEATMESIVNCVRIWLSHMTMHQKLGPWVQEESSDLVIEDVLAGRKTGVLLPEAVYGLGGVAISALCLRRLYDAAKRRGESAYPSTQQKPVLLVADEVQHLITQHDIETALIAKSLGLSMILSTQNLEGLYKRLKKEGAVQLFGNLGSLIAFSTRSQESNDYVSKRIGKIWKTTTENATGFPDAMHDIGLYTENGTDTNRAGSLLNSPAINGFSRWGGINGWRGDRIPNQRPWLSALTASQQALYQQFKPVLKFEPTDVVAPEEIDILLAQPQTAIAILNRGHIARRDIIQLGGVN